MAVTIRLFGSMRVIGPQQEELTPNGQKIKALLSLLAVANGEMCTREWLQKKLWSDRSARQAQDSLRHAIKKLKNSLGHYKDILIVTRNGVSLDKAQTTIDLHEKTLCSVPEDSQFLYSIKVRDKEFNRWLAAMRAEVESHHSISEVPLVQKNSSINIGILPLVTAGSELDAQIVGNTLISRLGISLCNLGFFNIYDYSGVIGENHTTHTAVEQDSMLLVRCNCLNGAIVISLSMTCPSSKRLLWSIVHTISAKEEVSEILPKLTTQFTDQIASVLSNPGVFGDPDRHIAAKLVIGAIDKIFSTSSAGLDEAEYALSKAIEIEGKGVYYAWYAYLMAFRFEDLKGQYENEYKAKTHYLMDKAITQDGNNPLTLSLVAHVYSFVFRDFNRAETLLERALTIDPDLILALDSYALLNFYEGNLEKARYIASQVFQRSLFNPYRFCFATSLCMIDTVMGDYSAAVKHGEKAISIHRPNQKNVFAPTLRYLAAAHANVGNRERAAEVFQIMKSQDPAFEVSAMLEDDFPVPNRVAASILSRALGQVEVDAVA